MLPKWAEVRNQSWSSETTEKRQYVATGTEGGLKAAFKQALLTLAMKRNDIVMRKGATEKQPRSGGIMVSMFLESGKMPLLLLVITAFVCSRALFFFFHDPEGPNLLIVTVLALILYSASFIARRFIPATTATKKLLFAICTQLFIVTGLYTIA